MTDLHNDGVTNVTGVTDLNNKELSSYTDDVTACNQCNQPNDEPEADGTVPLETRPVFVTYTEPTPPYKRPGLWFHGISTKGAEPELVDTWICTPIFAEAQTYGA
ncbi:MAG: hypothetical protein OWQ56_11535, partial [Acidithiobacillus caldus]|nr:hypothetical protein [Acidithiobacillus caldus]